MVKQKRMRYFLLILLLFNIYLTKAQEELEVLGFPFSNSNIDYQALARCASQKTEEVIGFGFSSFDDNALKERFENLIVVKGMKEKKIKLYPCNNVMNAVAVTFKKDRYIFYNPVFFQSVITHQKDPLEVSAILAHELGHHYKDHKMDSDLIECLKDCNSPICEENISINGKSMEQEADLFAGYTLAQLEVRTKEEAVQIFSKALKIAGLTDEFNSCSLHSVSEYRKKSIERGYEQFFIDEQDNNLSAYDKIQNLIKLSSEQKATYKHNQLYEKLLEYIWLGSRIRNKTNRLFYLDDGYLAHGLFRQTLLKKDTDKLKRDNLNRIIEDYGYFKSGLLYKAIVAGLNENDLVRPLFKITIQNGFINIYHIVEENEKLIYNSKFNEKDIDFHKVSKLITDIHMCYFYNFIKNNSPFLNCNIESIELSAEQKATYKHNLLYETLFHYIMSTNRNTLEKTNHLFYILTPDFRLTYDQLRTTRLPKGNSKFKRDSLNRIIQDYGHFETGIAKKGRILGLNETDLAKANKPILKITIQNGLISIYHIVKENEKLIYSSKFSRKDIDFEKVDKLIADIYACYFYKFFKNNSPFLDCNNESFELSTEQKATYKHNLLYEKLLEYIYTKNKIREKTNDFFYLWSNFYLADNQLKNNNLLKYKSKLKRDSLNKIIEDYGYFLTGLTDKAETIIGLKENEFVNKPLFKITIQNSLINIYHVVEENEKLIYNSKFSEKDIDFEKVTKLITDIHYQYYLELLNKGE